jgi:hypothetical protein
MLNMAAKQYFTATILQILFPYFSLVNQVPDLIYMSKKAGRLGYTVRSKAHQVKAAPIFQVQFLFKRPRCFGSAEDMVCDATS